MRKGRFKVILLMGLTLFFVGIMLTNVSAQVYPGNYDPVYSLPVSYYYTNPLYFTDYGYFNSINDPFYPLGYGFYSSLEGNLLGYYNVNPFLSPYDTYLYNYFGNNTYPYIGSPYTTVFPFNTPPGTMLPYTRFSYPSFVYGSPDFYLSWTMLQ